MKASGSVAVPPLLRGVPVKLVADVAGRGLNLVLAVLIARRLGAAGLGDFQFGMSLAWMFAILTDIGFNLYTTGEVSRDPTQVRQILGRVLSIKLLLGAILLLASAPFSRPIVLFLSASVFVGTSIDIVACSRRGLQQLAIDAAIGFSARCAAFVGGCATLLLSSSLQSAALGMFLTQSGVLLFLCLHERPIFSLGGWKAAVRDSLPIGVASAAAIFYIRADLVLIHTLSGAGATGSYAAASRLCEGTLILPAAMMSAVFPRMVRRREDAGRRALEVLVPASIVAAVSLGLLARPLLKIVFGFDEGVSALRILAIALIPTFINSVLLHELLARRRQFYNALISSGALAINISLNLVLIPIHGAEGAAVAWLLTETSIGLAALVLLRKDTRSPFRFGTRNARIQPALATVIVPDSQAGSQ